MNSNWTQWIDERSNSVQREQTPPTEIPSQGELHVFYVVLMYTIPTVNMKNLTMKKCCFCTIRWVENGKSTLNLTWLGKAFSSYSRAVRVTSTLVVVKHNVVEWACYNFEYRFSLISRNKHDRLVPTFWLGCTILVFIRTQWLAEETLLIYPLACPDDCSLKGEVWG